jgi:hypothetical protein
MIKRGLGLAAIVVLALVLCAQDPVVVHSLALVAGRGELLQFGRDVA